jgi:Peptidase family C54.
VHVTIFKSIVGAPGEQLKKLLIVCWLYRMLMWYFVLLGLLFTFLILVFICCSVSVYIQDIVDLCDISQSQPQDTTNSVYSSPSWKALILLVPVRLGAEKMNSVYGSCLTGLLTFENCIGIIGGRPKHSLYFVGFQGKLLHYTANSSTFLCKWTLKVEIQVKLIINGNFHF